MSSGDFVTYLSWACMVLTIVCSFFVVTARWPIFGAMALIGSLLATAALFVCLSAPFNAVTQVLVYAGGILVLFIYILMLLGVKRSEWTRGKKIALYLVFFVSIIAGLLPVFVKNETTVAPSFAAVTDNFGSIEEFGRALIHEAAYPFELISVILVATIVGVVYLTRRDE